MKCRIFTLLFAFLAIAGNAVWGQNGSGTEDCPWEINIGFMYNQTTAPSGTTTDAYVITPWTTTEGEDAYSNKLEIKAGGYYKLTGTHSNIQITVSATDPVYITLASGLHVDASLDNTVDTPDEGHNGSGVWSNRCAMQINTGAYVTLDWEGENKDDICELSSGGYRAGINVKPNAILVLKGTHEGTLRGTCWNNRPGVYTTGAGIGGDSEEPNFGTIIIENGNVEGRCYAQVTGWKAYGAGIGGGFKKTNDDNEDSGTGSANGTIIIKGGNVTGTANYPGGSDVQPTTGRSAAIGGGYNGTCTNIAILGGTINNNTATGEDVDVIGVGEDYEGGITKGIIIGQWNKETKPKLPEDIDINETNYLNGTEATKGIVTVNGEVTMPDKTQVYIIYKINDNSRFNAYNVKLNQNVLGDSHELSDDSNKEYGNRNKYYYGANMSFTETPLACNQEHLFMGWYDANATTTIVPIKEEKATFIMPSTPPTSLTTYEYDAVWVDNEMDITVRTSTTWAGKTGDYTPEIEYVPTDLNVNNLTFSLSTYDGNTTMPSEFTDLKFEGNQLQGKVNLQGDDTYKKIVIKAKVKLGDDGEEKETTINVVIVDEYMINSASVDLNKEHVYNGQLHNGTSGTEMDEWVLDVKMTEDIMGDPLQEPATLREGKHYRIYQYTYNKGTNPETAKDDTESLPIKNAGTYSNITIEAINDALFDFTLDPQQTGKYTLATDQVITVAQREMNVLLKAEVTTLDELNQLKESKDIESLVNLEEMNGFRGLVEGEEPEINGTISSIEKKEGSDNIYLVTIERSSFQIGESTTFLPSNYKMKVGSEELTDKGKMPEDGDEDLVIEVEIKGNDNDNTNDNIHIDRPKKYYHIYIDTVCPGLQLELSKDSVIEGGQVSVYLTVEEKCDTTGFTFEYKRGLKKWWQDLKPLEGVQPGEYIIKNIYSDIYIQALDAILEIEEEPTGIEDVEGAKVYAKEGTIYVYTPNHERVMIVSMNGAIVKSAEQEGMQSYSLNRGIYIVRIGDKVFKIKN